MAALRLGPATAVQLRRSVSRRGHRFLLTATLLLGVLGAVAVAWGAPTPQLTFGLTSLAVQLLMSVTVPFTGVLLTSDLRAAAPHRLTPRLLAAVTLACGYALYEILLSTVTVAVASPSPGAGPWQHATAIALGSVSVPVIAQLSGTGLGMLLRSPAVAMTATIVLPLGLWLVLGVSETLRPAQAWLTPFASATNLLLESNPEARRPLPGPREAERPPPTA